MILDLSKVLMQDFYCNYTKNRYGGKVEMFSADADSLMYKIKTGNIYWDFYENIQLFDFSNYQKIQIDIIIPIT